MSSLELIKKQIKTLFETDPRVHVNISIPHPKLNLQNDPALIKGVYPRVFRLEETSSGYPQCHTVQYTDLLTGHLEIVELSGAAGNGPAHF